jgi:hypothetical protein
LKLQFTVYFFKFTFEVVYVPDETDGDAILDDGLIRQTTGRLPSRNRNQVEVEFGQLKKTKKILFLAAKI